MVFCYSLHHVPREHLHKAIHEAMRVLRDDGFLLVAEPVPEGEFAAVMQPFHDETLVQLSAERALAAHARPRFRTECIYRYTTCSRYRDFDAFVDEMLAPTYIAYSREAVARDAVRLRFEACRAAEGYALHQPMRINLDRHPRPAHGR